MNDDDAPNVEEALLSACPSFRSRRDELRREWVEGEPSLFNVLDYFGHHLAQRIAEGETAEVIPVLTIVEETLRRGSEPAVHATTFGLLSSLQSSLKHNGLNPDELLLRHCGTTTKAWWNDLRKNPDARRDW